MSASSSNGAGAAEQVARRAKDAFNAASLRLPSGSRGDEIRRGLLSRLRRRLESSRQEIETANRVDVAAAQEANMSASLISRLDLFTKAGKWESMLEGVDQVAALASPLEQCTFAKQLAESGPDGADELDLYRITCPIGVLLCIFEARPEVVVNIACLAIKSGNAAILKGGKESARTTQILSRLLRESLEETAELPSDLIQTIETREDVASLLRLDEYIDLVIPRGSNELVKNIQRQASIPVMGHADGLCCAYIHHDAQQALTVTSIVESKIDYPAACNAVETILVHPTVLVQPLYTQMVEELHAAGVTVHVDEACHAALHPKLASSERTHKASPEDFGTEWLSLDVAIKAVDSLEEAIQHINMYGSHHTDVLFTAAQDGSHPNPAAATFVRSVDSANVFINTSTRFSDGFRYGFGKRHARGPVGLEGLVTYKYVLQGKGNRPHTVGDFSAGQRQWSHADIARKFPPV